VEFGSWTAATASSRVVRALARGTLKKAASGYPGTSVPPASAPHTVHTKVFCHSLKIHNRPGRDLLGFLAGLTYGFAIEVEPVTTQRRTAGNMAHHGAWEGVK